MKHQSTPIGRGRYARRADRTTMNKPAFRIPIVGTPEMARTWDEAATRLNFDNRSQLVRTAVAEFIDRKGREEATKHV